jgi:hypothetical protein
MKITRSYPQTSRHLSVVVAAIAAIVSADAGRAAHIFLDDMSTGANWTINQTPDSSAQFGYDYSQKGLPPAPSGGGDTIGLKFEVNNNPPGGVEQIIAHNANAAYTGKYTVRVDAWINWALVNGGTGTGTTQYAGISAGHNGAAPGLAAASLIYDGDGDVASDYALYKNGALQVSYDNFHPMLAQAFPSINVAAAVPAQGQTGATFPGAGGFQWMTLNAEVDTTSVGPAGLNGNLGWARFTMRSAASGNIVEIGTIDNSDGGPVVPLSGGIALLMLDIFPSVTTNPAFSFGIFDNVQVFEGLVPIPEPTSALLLIGAALSLPWRSFRRNRSAR